MCIRARTILVCNRTNINFHLAKLAFPPLNVRESKVVADSHNSMSGLMARNLSTLVDSSQRSYTFLSPNPQTPSRNLP
jgi:hypothetical protein